MFQILRTLVTQLQ